MVPREYIASVRPTFHVVGCVGSEWRTLSLCIEPGVRSWVCSWVCSCLSSFNVLSDLLRCDAESMLPLSTLDLVPSKTCHPCSPKGSDVYVSTPYLVLVIHTTDGYFPVSFAHVTLFVRRAEYFSSNVQKTAPAARGSSRSASLGRTRKSTSYPNAPPPELLVCPQC